MKKLIGGTMIVMAMTFAAAMPLMADTAWVGGYTWTYRVIGDTAEIGKSGSDAAISPLPTGDLTIPDTLGGKTVTSIGDYAFNSCSSLASVTIPDGVTDIGDATFAFCTNLTSVTIPAGVTNIGDSAFASCRSLSAVLMEGNAPAVADNSFEGCRPTVYVNYGSTGWDGDPSSAELPASGEWNGCPILRRGLVPGEGTVTKPKSWKTGQKVTWKAKSGKGSVFARWKGEFVESLGLSRNELRNPSLAFIVPQGFDESQVSAEFIPLDEDGLHELSFRDGDGNPLGGEDGILLEFGGSVEFWLVDDSRSYVTASVSGLPKGLKFDAKTLKITGKPTKRSVCWVQVKAKNASGYQWAEKVRMAVLGYTTESEEPKLTRTAYHPLTVISTNTAAGTATGTGVYAEGKKVSISAKPAKGWVFAGWYRDMALQKPMAFASGDYRKALQSVVVPEVRYLFARFVTSEEDKGSIAAGLNGVDLEEAAVSSKPPYQTNVWAGVYFQWPVAVSALSATAIKVAGLPAGLKFTAKDIVDSKTKQVTVPANTIYGAPTAASKKDKNGNVMPSDVKITVTTAGESSAMYLVKLTVEALPAWAVGTFDGAAYVGDSANASGIVQAFTVAANGKISGKLLEGGQTWTLSAANFSRVERVDRVEESDVFCATVIGKAGKEVVTNEMTVLAANGIGVATGNFDSQLSTSNSQLSTYTWQAFQNLWKRADTKAVQPVIRKDIKFDHWLGEQGDKNNMVTLAFKKDGVVSFAGMVGGVKVSGSSQLVQLAGDGSSYQVTLYAPPKPTAKPPFEGWCETFAVELTVDDQNLVTGVDVK